MKLLDLRQGLLGMLSALISVILVVGSLVLSLTEGEIYIASAPTQSASMTPTAVLPEPSEAFREQAATSMVTPVLTQTPYPTPSFTSTTLPPSPPSACTPPDGWFPLEVQVGDTLKSLAQSYRVSEEFLAQSNCLLTGVLVAGTTLYVPGPLPTAPPVVCGPPAGWVYYIVQSGDTLYNLSRIYGVSVTRLQVANCLGSSTFIRIGQRLFVPFYIPPTATWTATLVPTPTVTPSLTPVPTLVPTSTYTSVPSSTPTLPVEFTSAPDDTDTPEPLPTDAEDPEESPEVITTEAARLDPTPELTPPPPEND